MFLNDFITIVAVNEGVIPDNQRRDQLALFEDITFRRLMKGSRYSMKKAGCSAGTTSCFFQAQE